MTYQHVHEGQTVSSSPNIDQHGDSQQGQSSTARWVVPGSIGKLEDDLVLQVVDLAQPAVIGYVVTIHERLRKQEAKPYKHQALYFEPSSESSHNAA